MKRSNGFGRSGPRRLRATTGPRMGAECAFQLGRSNSAFNDPGSRPRNALSREIRHGDGVADSLIALAELRIEAGDARSAADMLHEALELAEQQSRPQVVALAHAHLARLQGGDVDAALGAIEKAGDEGQTAEMWWHLGQATHDRSHLDTAKRLLDEQLAKVPEEYHEAMRTNVRVNRQILAAAGSS